MYLGKQEWERLKRVEADQWYPIEQLLGLMEILEAHVGPYGLMQMGRRLFELSHKDRVKVIAKSARDIVYGIDDMYHHANNGRGIGGWKVLKFEPGLAELEKNTPHHCVMEQGILTEALLTVGCAANVSQTKCFRDGAETTSDALGVGRVAVVRLDLRGFGPSLAGQLLGHTGLGLGDSELLLFGHELGFPSGRADGDHGDDTDREDDEPDLSFQDCHVDQYISAAGAEGPPSPAVT